MPYTDFIECMQWRYQGIKSSLSSPPSYSESQAFILGTLYNTNIFGKLLPNHTDFFRVHINQINIFREFLPHSGDFFRVHIYESYY